MRLKTLRIQNYKCIDDSTEFSIPEVTCLVGKNESGKSAILQALYRLNPAEPEESKFDEIQEYPRKGLTDYEKIRDKSPANVLTTSWDIEEKDEKALADKFGINPLAEKTIVVEKGYDNSTCWDIELDEQKVLKHYLEQLGFESGEIGNGTKITSISDLIAYIEREKTPKKEWAEMLARLKKDIPGGQLEDSVIHFMPTLLPKFLYFDDYHKLPARVPFEVLIQKISSGKLDFSDRIFLALLNLAGTTPKEIQELGTLEHLIARLEGVSNKLTREIFEYWSQNEYLRVNFLFEKARPQDPPPNNGYIFMTRIENTRHQVSVSFGDRSSGFIWFFSFLVWFSYVKKEYGDNLFILLDEPGLSLHAKAQADLLRYINEKLKPHFQVIYTAHSPFMVDPENILSVRTVEDVTEKKQILGTKVGDQVLSTDADTLFPLQTALGYEITQTLFVGKNTLLVEGPSDLLYLSWFSHKLISAGRVGLDRRWTEMPSGGLDKISSFITLFRGNKLNVAVFTDFHAGEKKKVKSLKESEILKSGQVFSAELYAGQDEGDIEDIIGRKVYVFLVNKGYGLKGKKQLQMDKPSDAPARVVVEVENHFRMLSPDVPEFDHYRPAEYLTLNPSDIEDIKPDIEESLNRFERLFKDLNALLDKSNSC